MHLSLLLSSSHHLNPTTGGPESPSSSMTTKQPPFSAPIYSMDLGMEQDSVTQTSVVMLEGYGVVRITKHDLPKQAMFLVGLSASACIKCSLTPDAGNVRDRPAVVESSHSCF